ncbi:GNAT family N-acetyltransferase [Bacillus sp. DJP31]|uniref:GNAT family N-acetyltransferase n=1 Tax=Bacillus sp. DJP31 TaxID=3409789 RepID=UPI003BB7A268
MEYFDYRSETDRLIIRPYDDQDFENWFLQNNNTMRSQHKYDEGKMDMSFCTEDWFALMVEKHQQLAKDDKAYVFGIFRKEDNAHIGVIDFSTLIRQDFQWARFGYTILNQHWNKGYGKEAVKKSLNLAFEKLNYHRIEAHINLDNVASIKLAESVGMQYECIRKGFIQEFGDWTDNLVYFINP